MALLTAQDYIVSALRKIGQLRPGAVPNTDFLADCLNEWGLLFDSWAAERTMGFSIPTYEYAVTGPGSVTNGNGYLIGPQVQMTGTQTGANIVSVVNTSSLGAPSLSVGEAISGPGIPAGTVISAIDMTTPMGANTLLTLSKNVSVSGSQTLTATPDFVGPRPDSIVRLNLVFTSSNPQPVYIPVRLISMEEWSSLAVQQIPGINVTAVAYYDPQWPNGVLNVFPPLNGNSLQIYTWDALAVPANKDRYYNAPPGYAEAVIYSLAEQLWPMCTNQIMINRVSYQHIAGKAHLARERVRNVNRAIPLMPLDFRGSTQPAGFYDSFVSYTGEPY